MKLLEQITLIIHFRKTGVRVVIGVKVVIVNSQRSACDSHLTTDINLQKQFSYFLILNF